jgi:ER membrane protein complex subunit 3
MKISPISPQAPQSALADGFQCSYWILIPITIVMVLTGVLRHYASVLMATPPKKVDAKTMREQRSLARGVALRNNYHSLSQRSFEARRETLTAGYESGAFLKEPDKKGQPPANPLSDPSAMDGMMGMMKNNMAMMIPNTLIMSWINAFFSGYVISTRFECF